MRRTTIKSVLQNPVSSGDVKVCGWIRTKRVSKKFAFIVISDGSCQDTLQLIVDEGTPDFSKVADLTTGTALSVVGEIKPSQGKGQSIELLVKELHEIGGADAATYPLQKKGHSLEFLREIAHLRPRTNTFGAVFRVRNALAMGVHNFFQSRNFYWVHTPIITASDCEGAGEMFGVTTLNLNDLPKVLGSADFSSDFFGGPAYLTVSGQLQAEFLAMGMGNVYTFGPTFRAENSNTTRHLAEFWMIEPEMAFSDLTDVCDLAEDFLKSCIGCALETCPQELAFLAKHYKNISLDGLRDLAAKSFTRLTYSDAIKELNSAGRQFEFPVSWGLDLQAEHERYLTDEVFKGPVIVTDYPKDIKSFYMRANDDGKTVAAMDVLVPQVGEIMGGSQREERLSPLKDLMAKKGIEEKHLNWYLDLRRYGSTPHGGFGLGFERLVQYLTGMGNIRDTIPCPRSPKHAQF
jgi:asparaginyl-tRNA synthetase